MDSAQTLEVGQRVRLSDVFPKQEVWTRELNGSLGTVRGTFVFETLADVQVGPPGQETVVGSGYTIHAVELDEPFMSEETANAGLDYLDFQEIVTGGKVPSPRTCFPDLAIGNGSFQFAPPEVLELVTEGTDTE